VADSVVSLLLILTCAVDPTTGTNHLDARIIAIIKIYWAMMVLSHSKIGRLDHRASFQRLRSGRGWLSLLMGSDLHSVVYARQKPVNGRRQNESPCHYCGNDYQSCVQAHRIRSLSDACLASNLSL